MPSEFPDFLRVTMPDGSKWDVLVSVIAWNRAKHYASEYGGNAERSLKEDTMPFFTEDHIEIKEWASNNMNWDDVAKCAVCVRKPPAVDYQEGWVNGEREIIYAK